MQGATLSGHGSVQLACPDTHFDAHAEIDGLPIADELVARMPDPVREAAKLFRPTGTVGVRIDDLPITPEKVLRALRAQGGAKPQQRR